MQAFVICHGNIARSQILSAYLERTLNDHQLNGVSVRSCGTVETLGVFRNEDQLLSQVEEQLRQRGFSKKLSRTLWNEDIARSVRDSDVILVADENRRREVIERLGPDIRSKTFLFYEFIGEGVKDFTDTYDHTTAKQDPVRFDSCFDELHRIALSAAEKLNVFIREVSE